MIQNDRKSPYYEKKLTKEEGKVIVLIQRAASQNKKCPLIANRATCKLCGVHVGSPALPLNKVIMVLVNWKQPKLTDNELK